jgi:hypothetical protein
MNVTRFCVSVKPFVQGKQYALTTSVTPILSSQKRYQLKIDNRRILGQIYPVIVPKYSKRYGEERLPETAKRRVREVEVTHIDFEQSAKKASVLLKELDDFTSAERLLEAEAHLTLSNELDRLTTKEISLNTLSEWNRDHKIDIQLSEQKTFTRERTEDIHLSEHKSFERIEPSLLVNENNLSLFDRFGEPLTANITAFNELEGRNEKSMTDAVLGVDEEAIRYALSDVRLLGVEESRKIDNVIHAVLSRPEELILLRGLLQTVLLDGAEESKLVNPTVYEHIFELFNRIKRLEELSPLSWAQSKHVSEINDAIEDNYESAKTDISCDVEIYNDFCLFDLTRDSVDGQLDLIEKADRDLLIETAASIPLQEAEVSQKEQLAVIEEDEIAAAANRTFDATDINGHDASRSEQAEDVESKGLEEASPTSAVVDVDATTFDIEELTRSQTEDVYMLAANDVATLLQQAKELSLINGIDNFSLVRDVIKAILDESIGQGTFKGRYVYEHIIELFQRIDNEPYESSMMHSELVQKISETVQAMLNNHEAAEVQRQLQSAVIEMTSEMSRSVNVELIDETLYSSADKNKKEVLVASEQLNDADRSASEQIILCEKTESVDQALSEWNAELQEVEQATNQWLVIEADLNPHEMADRIREVMYQAGFAGYETFERMMEQVVSLDQLEASGRELEKDIVLSHFVFAEHDVIENVIMANFNEAIRDILEIVYVDEIEDSDIIQKKKKRIWLIPAKPNFYSGWTWKKTR